jgi:Zn finger protein HypA/HybF involved in hydrogenase expression
MSWGCFNVMKCKKCGHEYKVEVSTLSLYENKSKCPKCDSKAIKINTQSMLDEMNRQTELFKTRKKRLTL